MNLSQILTLTRQCLHEASAAHWSDADVARMIDVAIKYHTSILKTHSVGFFIRSSYISYVAGQYEYDWPAMATRIHWIDRVDNVDPVPVVPITRSEAGRYRTTSQIPSRVQDAYILEGNKITIVPTPSESITNVLRVYYIKRPADINQGTLASGGASSVVLPATPGLGILTPLDNAYEGMQMDILSGTGVGLRNTIGGYVTATRTASFGTAWATPPDGTSVYSFVPELPEEWHPLLAYKAASDLLASAKDDTSIIDRKYQQYESQMRTDEGLRQEQKPAHVHYVEEWS